MAKVDEAPIYLSDTNAKSKVQYLIRDQNRRDLTPSTTVPHPKGIMVKMGISANGVTKPRFVQPGAFWSITEDIEAFSC
ncbi:hypothetical protein AVEN_179128-1 [Araneus ventricosus]|uniref:Uncharacterized protein n=1 Tax=Araneus ventricosus TaxID=182803 RepID=A0A4Y2F718_ARAVE|nr:hypothetical protein AVEN_179128-1 [Araneus ventricosus]